MASGSSISRASRSARRRPAAPIGRRCATSRRCSVRSITSRGARGGGPRRPTAARSTMPASTSTAGSARARERFLEAYAAGLARAAGLGRHRPGPAARLRGRQGAVRVRLRHDVPADLAVRPDRGDARAVRGRRVTDRVGRAARRHPGRPGGARRACSPPTTRPTRRWRASCRRCRRRRGSRSRVSAAPGTRRSIAAARPARPRACPAGPSTRRRAPRRRPPRTWRSSRSRRRAGRPRSSPRPAAIAAGAGSSPSPTTQLAAGVGGRPRPAAARRARRPPGIATRTFRATVAVLAMLAGTDAGVAGLDRRGRSRRRSSRPRSLAAEHAPDALDGAAAIDVLADAATSASPSRPR